ncbi:MAG: hypothetical protein ABWY20_23840 [Mycobacterium sp.]
MSALKRCTICGQNKPATSEHFTHHSQMKDGLHPRCRECQRVGQSAEWYPIDLFRERAERLLRQGTPLTVLATRGGFINSGRDKPDTSAFQRACGLKVETTHARLVNGEQKVYREHVRKRVSYGVAVKLCDALDIDYTDVGV